MKKIVQLVNFVSQNPGLTSTEITTLSGMEKNVVESYLYNDYYKTFFNRRKKYNNLTGRTASKFSLSKKGREYQNQSQNVVFESGSGLCVSVGDVLNKIDEQMILDWTDDLTLLSKRFVEFADYINENKDKKFVLVKLQ